MPSTEGYCGSEWVPASRPQTRRSADLVTLPTTTSLVDPPEPASPSAYRVDSPCKSRGQRRTGRAPSIPGSGDPGSDLTSLVAVSSAYPLSPAALYSTLQLQSPQRHFRGGLPPRGLAAGLCLALTPNGTLPRYSRPNRQQDSHDTAPDCRRTVCHSRRTKFPLFPEQPFNGHRGVERLDLGRRLTARRACQTSKTFRPRPLEPRRWNDPEPARQGDTSA